MARFGIILVYLSAGPGMTWATVQLFVGPPALHGFWAGVVASVSAILIPLAWALTAFGVYCLCAGTPRCVLPPDEQA